MGDRNLVEFYCTASGGGCGGYFRLPINIKIDGVVEIVCPKCEHKHQRTIKKGEITDDHRWDEKPKQEVLGNIAAWSKKPVSKLSKKRAGGVDERKSVVLEKAEDRSFIDERQFEIHGGKL